MSSTADNFGLLATNTSVNSPNKPPGEPPYAPALSQLAQRLTQPLPPRPGPPHSPQQLRSLLQRPAPAPGDALILTQASGTPISTTKVWMPGTVQASVGYLAS